VEGRKDDDVGEEGGKEAEQADGPDPKFVQVLVSSSPPCSHYLDTQMRLIAESQACLHPEVPTDLQNAEAQSIHWNEWLQGEVPEETMSKCDGSDNQVESTPEHNNEPNVYRRMERAFRYQREFDLDVEYTRSLRELCEHGW
jgi:hypothetical protein